MKKDFAVNDKNMVLKYFNLSPLESEFPHLSQNSVKEEGSCPSKSGLFPIALNRTVFILAKNSGLKMLPCLN
jgi:hypothetical protein